MNTKNILLVTRVAIGWVFLYAGIAKIASGTWSAAGYLGAAKTFPGLFDWFASPAILPFTNFLNEWGQVAIGISLILGLWSRIGGWAGAIMMLLYYFPILDFPYPDAHSYIVDSHIIYALLLAYIAESRTDEIWSIRKLIKRW